MLREAGAQAELTFEKPSMEHSRELQRAPTEPAAERREAYLLALSGIVLDETDLVMPGLDGRRLSQQLRERHPGLRVLYVSGYTPENLVIDAADPGVGFLAKPFTAANLLAKVRATLDAS